MAEYASAMAEHLGYRLLQCRNVGVDVREQLSRLPFDPRPRALVAALEHALTDTTFNSAHAAGLIAGGDDENSSDAVHVILAIAALEVAEDLYYRILGYVDSIEGSLMHWRRTKQRSFLYLLEYSPSYWAHYFFPTLTEYTGFPPSLPPLDEIETKLELLQRVEPIFLSALGEINYLITLSSVSTSDQCRCFALHLLRAVSHFHASMAEVLHGSFPSGLATIDDDISLSSALDRIVHQAHATFQFPKAIRGLWQRVSVPHPLVRHWFYYLVGGIAAVMLIRVAVSRSDQIAQLFRDAKSFAAGFYENQVKGVLTGIYDTVRYTADEEVMQLKQKAVAVSEESLGRMVVQYNLEKHTVPPPVNMEKLMQAASHGDLSTIMPRYEQELQHPLKNIVIGDFVRLLLIQVQKQKVDVENAMLQIDKLLRANELNFQLLAAVPLLLLLMGLKNFAFAERLPHRVHAALRSALRDTHVLLTKAIATEAALRSSNAAVAVGDFDVYLDLASHGRITLSIYRLTRNARRLRGSVRYHFLDDVQLLEKEDFTVEQRLETIRRMLVTYSFLAVTK